MGNALRILPSYTYDDYLHWEGRWELIEGIPYAMSPAPHHRHQLIANNLAAVFHGALKSCDKCSAYQPIDYKIAEDTVVQPDLLVVCGPIKEAYLDFPPALVVEILSPATASKDRLYKYELYQQEGIGFYLIVDTDKESVEVFELENGKFVLRQQGRDFPFDFSFGPDCTAAIRFSEIWD